MSLIHMDMYCQKQTRMTIFIKAQLNKSDDQTNIDKYRVAANITEYHIISTFIFIIPKFLMVGQLFYKVNIHTMTNFNNSYMTMIVFFVMSTK